MLDLKKIVNKYDNFILDVWGVLHDGMDALPHAVEFVRYLKNNNKKFCILSNSPRPRKNVHDKLLKLGFDIEENLITTSGEFFLSIFQKFANDNIYVLGEERNVDLLKNVTIQRAESIEKAQLLLMLFFANSLDEVALQRPILEKAAQLQVKMLCTNPDIVAQEGKGIIYTQGTFAQIYKEYNGEVIYFGKPYRDIYEYVFNQYNFKKDATLMIGDSLATDIRGAKNYGIDSLLLFTGIHNESKDAEALFAEYDCSTTFRLDNLQLNDML